jgi:hypothetical protein
VPRQKRLRSIHFSRTETEQIARFSEPELGRDDYRTRLTQGGIDFAGAEQCGQFKLVGWTESYLKDGRFDKDRVLGLITRTLNVGKDQGYKSTQLVGHMEWALEEHPGVEDLLEYEARVTDISGVHTDAVCCCVYDLAVRRRYCEYHTDASAVMMGGILLENRTTYRRMCFCAKGPVPGTDITATQRQMSLCSALGHHAVAAQKSRAELLHSGLSSGSRTPEQYVRDALHRFHSGEARRVIHRCERISALGYAYVSLILVSEAIWRDTNR